MATIAEYFTQLQTDKQNLVNNLVAKGVEATNDETFTSLVPKVNSTANLADYFKTSGLQNSSSLLMTQILLAIPPIDCTSLTTLAHAFDGWVGIIPRLLNTQNVTSLESTFYRITANTLDISDLNTSNVSNFQSAFGSISSLSELDLTNLDTSNATTFMNMFTDFGGYDNPTNLIGFTNLNFSKVTSMFNMFGNSNILFDNSTTFDLSNKDLSSVNNIHYLFRNNKSIEHINLSNCGMTIKNNFNYTFSGCEVLKSVDLSGNTLEVTSFDRVFESDTMLESVILPSGTFSNTYITELCSGCSSLKTFDMSNVSGQNLKNIIRAFSGCTSLELLDIRQLSLSSITSFDSAFDGVPNNCLIIVKDTESKNWLTSKFTNLTNVKTVAELGV